MPFSFFQAEDGIRYHCVTGVQTCALPISGHYARDGGPGAGSDADGVDLDRDVGSEDEEGLEVLDVLVDALRLGAVGPGYDDVFGVSLVDPIPFLGAEAIEVERVDQVAVALHLRRLL